MVDQLPLHADAHPTLDDVWSDLAARTSRRVAIVLAGSGLAAAAWSRWADLSWVLTLSTMVVAAFGCDALLRANQLGDGRPEKRTIRGASAIARAVAAVSAAAIGLILLGVIFGGRIEVMRR